MGKGHRDDPGAEREGEISDDGMKIDGGRGKRFRIYLTDIQRRPYECIEEYDTADEVHSRRWRLDKVELVGIGRDYYTYSEFCGIHPLPKK